MALPAVTRKVSRPEGRKSISRIVRRLTGLLPFSRPERLAGVCVLVRDVECRQPSPRSSMW
jgi:hypothetical protein